MIKLHGIYDAFKINTCIYKLNYKAHGVYFSQMHMWINESKWIRIDTMQHENEINTELLEHCLKFMKC